MNQFVEDYLEALMTAALAATGDTATLYKATTGDIAEPSENSILLVCDEMEGVVGSLRLAKVRVVVRTPALTGDRSEHQTLARVVSRVFLGTLPSAASYGITELTVSGHHVTDQQTGQGENQTWITNTAATLGVNLLDTSPI